MTKAQTLEEAEEAFISITSFIGKLTVIKRLTVRKHAQMLQKAVLTSKLQCIQRNQKMQ